MANKSRKKKKRVHKSPLTPYVRIPAIIIIVLGLILLSAQALVHLYQQEILAFAIARIEKNTGDMYNIRYRKAGLNLIKGNISLEINRI